jgi:formate dehydrogenase subunit delta
MSPDRLIYMANQIGKFFHSQGHDKAVPSIAEHIRKFWDPRMRTAILAHLDAGGAGLDPQVRDAVAALGKAEMSGPLVALESGHPRESKAREQ